MICDYKKVNWLPDIFDLRDDCRLCKMIAEVLPLLEKVDLKKDSWNKELTIIDEYGKEDKLTLTGVIVKRPSGYTEVVRYFSIDSLFVNVLEDKKCAPDQIIGMPLNHTHNSEADFNSLIHDALKLIQNDYHGQARFLLNIGPKFATVPNHSHVQLFQTIDTYLEFPKIKRNY